MLSRDKYFITLVNYNTRNADQFFCQFENGNLSHVITLTETRFKDDTIEKITGYHSFHTILHQHGGLMDKTLELNAGRSGVRAPGRGKCSLRTIAVETNAVA